MCHAIIEVHTSPYRCRDFIRITRFRVSSRFHSYNVRSPFKRNVVQPRRDGRVTLTSDATRNGITLRKSQNRPVVPCLVYLHLLRVRTRRLPPAVLRYVRRLTPGSPPRWKPPSYRSLGRPEPSTETVRADITWNFENPDLP